MTASPSFGQRELDGVERVTFRGEAEIFRRVGFGFAVVELAGFDLGRAFAELPPRPRAVDGVAIHLEPFADCEQRLRRAFRNGAVRASGQRSSADCRSC